MSSTGPVEGYKVLEMRLFRRELDGNPVLAWESEGNVARGVVAYGEIAAVVLDAGSLLLTVEYVKDSRVLRMAFATAASLLAAYKYLSEYLCDTQPKMAVPQTS